MNSKSLIINDDFSNILGNIENDMDNAKNSLELVRQGLNELMEMAKERPEDKEKAKIMMKVRVALNEMDGELSIITHKVNKFF